MSVRFSFFAGDADYLSYGGKWISNVQNNGEFDWWFILELVNMDDACEDTTSGKYFVQLRIVAPSQVPEEGIKKALDSCGVEEMPDDILAMIEVLYSYGISAFIDCWQGNNAAELLKLAKGMANEVASFTFGFIMDKPQNRIGSTGWDFLRGDILAGARGIR